MLELVIFDADGVLFESADSNTAYYNAIFKNMGEPPLSPEEERLGVFLSANQVFEQRAGGDPQRLRRIAGDRRSIGFHAILPFAGPAL